MTRPKCPECRDGRLKGVSDAVVRNHDTRNWLGATLLGSPQKRTDLYEHCDVCGWGRVFTRRERRKRPAPAPVRVVYANDHGTDVGPLLPATATSKTGAVATTRAAGYRVLTVGGIVELAVDSIDRDGTERMAWTVTVHFPSGD
jgi:hypothetical protein